MEESLEDALNVLFGSKADNLGKEIEIIKDTTGQIPQSLDEKFAKASVLYEEAQQALQQGDFAAYAGKIEELGKVLGKD